MNELGLRVFEQSDKLVSNLESNAKHNPQKSRLLIHSYKLCS